MKNLKLRIAWIIPNVLCYLFFIGSAVFVINNSQRIAELNELSMWVITLLLLYLYRYSGVFEFTHGLKKENYNGKASTIR